LEDLDPEAEKNSAWETIRENIKISIKDILNCFELKKHKPWLDKGCSKLLNQSKQVKLQWLQDPSEINGDNLKNVRCETSRYFRNKGGNILKTNFMSLQQTVRTRISETCIEVSECKGGYQTRNYLVKDWNGDLLANSDNI
jgi:hypothetical protein